MSLLVILFLLAYLGKQNFTFKIKLKRIIPAEAHASKSIFFQVAKLNTLAQNSALQAQNLLWNQQLTTKHADFLEKTKLAQAALDVLFFYFNHAKNYLFFFFRKHQQRSRLWRQKNWKWTY